MILLDQNGVLVHDEKGNPGERVRTSLARRNITCSYANDSVLYRYNSKGNLFVVFLSKPKFHAVTIHQWDLLQFRQERRLATDKMIIRDVGCGQSQIYLDDCSFSVPTELLQ